jgi:hypothetical protein
MNDEELAAAVKESVRGAHMNVPAEQIVHRSRTIRARRRTTALAGGLTGAAAATAAAALVATSGPGAVAGQQATAGHARTVVTAAWTVSQDPNGTVTIYLRQYANPAGLQHTLRAYGINAIVRPIRSVLQTIARPPGLQSRKPGLSMRLPACMFAATNDAPPAVQKRVVTVPRQSDLPVAYIIRPGAMPRGSALFLTFLAGMPASFKNDNTGIMALPPVVLNNNTVPACVGHPKPSSTFAPKAALPKQA